MSKTWHLTIALVALVAVMGTGCTGNDLDDPGSADVVLEVTGLTNPVVRATLNRQTGICTFTIPEWSFLAANVPKSVAAGESSFNDISMIDVEITYEWLNPALSTPVRTVGLGGVVIPVSGTNTVLFSPIGFSDLSIANQGSTANLTMQFRAITIEGSPIVATVFRQLQIETCF